MLAAPDTLDELEELARDLSDLLDSIAAGGVDGSPALERLLVGALDDVETLIQDHLHAADAAGLRERRFLQRSAAAAS